MPQNNEFAYIHTYIHTYMAFFSGIHYDIYLRRERRLGAGQLFPVSLVLHMGGSINMGTQKIGKIPYLLEKSQFIGQNDWKNPNLKRMTWGPIFGSPLYFVFLSTDPSDSFPVSCACPGKPGLRGLGSSRTGEN